MKTVLLLRHGKSSWDDPALADFDRPLAKRGEKAAKAMGKVLAENAPRPDLVLCSKSLRTRETWDLARRAFAEAPPVELREDLYLASAAGILRMLQRLPASHSTVLVIGHNPGFEDLARRLAGPDSVPEAAALLREKYPTGALAVLEAGIGSWADLKPRGARLRDFFRPRDLTGG